MITVSVRGFDRVAHGLRTLAARVRDLAPAWRLVGARVIATAKPLTPVLTARLVNSLRAEATRDDLLIRAGGGSIEYAGVQNFGWAARNIKGHHYLEGGPAEAVARREAPRQVEALLTRTARLAGLT